MRWLLPLLGTAVGILAAACVSDGPLGFVPGGPFDARPESGPEPDWSFAADLDSVDVQIDSTPPRTVRTGIVVLENVPSLPVTYAPLKRWDGVVAESSRVILRADGRYFERHAVAVTDEAMRLRLVRAGQAKYGAPFHASWTSGITGYFRLEPVALTP